MNQARYKALLLLSVVLLVGSAKAEFTLNFLPDSTGTMKTSAIHSGLAKDNGVQSDQTPYLDVGGGYQFPEIVQDPDNGNWYYHMIVGDLASGFIQESYVQMGFGTYTANCCVPTVSGQSVASASGGGVTVNGAMTFDRTAAALGNGYDPLDLHKNSTSDSFTSGNGTGNPTRVIMRQILNDGEVMIEFLKDKYAYKPRISMMIIAPDITAFFDFDMRNSAYDDALTPGLMTSTISLWGEGAPNVSATFDHATEAQNPYVTGGMYSYAEGTDDTTDDADGKDFGGSNGIYSYTDGGFDQNSIPWGNYMDPLEANPWSFESAKSP